MIKGSVKITGVDEVLKKIISKTQQINLQSAFGLNEASETILDVAISKTPLDTGNLRNSAIIVGYGYTGRYSETRPLAGYSDKWNRDKDLSLLKLGIFQVKIDGKIKVATNNIPTVLIGYGADYADDYDSGTAVSNTGQKGYFSDTVKQNEDTILNELGRKIKRVL